MTEFTEQAQFTFLPGDGAVVAAIMRVRCECQTSVGMLVLLLGYQRIAFVCSMQTMFGSRRSFREDQKDGETVDWFVARSLAFMEGWARQHGVEMEYEQVGHLEPAERDRVLAEFGVLGIVTEPGVTYGGTGGNA